MSFSISPWNLINSMKSVEDWQNTINGNLTGATQIGYKQFDVYFGGGVTTTIRPPSLSGTAKQIAENFIQANYTMIDFSNGNLIDTQNWTDVAIDGEGFFMATSKLSNPSQDDIYFTRNGEWHIDSDGFLRSKEGLYILDGSQIPGSPNPGLTAVPPWIPGIFSAWNDREKLVVTNNTNRTLTEDTVVEMEYDTQNLFASGKVQADLDDLRVGYWDGATWSQVDMAFVDQPPVPSATTKIRFRLKNDLNPGQVDSNKYFLFYDNPLAGATPVPTQAIGIKDPDGVLDDCGDPPYSPQTDPTADPLRSVEDWLDVQGTQKWSIGIPPSPSDTWSGAPAGNINYIQDGVTGYTINGTNNYGAVVKSQVYRKWNGGTSSWDFVDANGVLLTMNAINGTNFGGTIDPTYDFSVDNTDLNAGKTNLDPTKTDWTKFDPSSVTTGSIPVLRDGLNVFTYDAIPAINGRWGDIVYKPGSGVTDGQPYIDTEGGWIGAGVRSANGQMWYPGGTFGSHVVGETPIPTTGSPTNYLTFKKNIYNPYATAQTVTISTGVDAFAKFYLNGTQFSTAVNGLGGAYTGWDYVTSGANYTITLQPGNNEMMVEAFDDNVNTSHVSISTVTAPAGIDIRADDSWLVKDINIDNSIWTGTGSNIDSQYLLLRQPINVSTQGLIRPTQTITIDGLVDENVSVFIRDASGALTPVYQDNTVGNNAWSGTFNQNLLTTGVNYIEVYASKDIGATNADWIKLDMSQFQGYTAGEINYTNGTGYTFTPEQLYLKPDGYDVALGKTKYKVVKADGSDPQMTYLNGVNKEVSVLPEFGTSNLGEVNPNAQYGATGWYNRNTGTISSGDGGGVNAAVNDNTYWSDKLNNYKVSYPETVKDFNAANPFTDGSFTKVTGNLAYDGSTSIQNTTSTGDGNQLTFEAWVNPESTGAYEIVNKESSYEIQVTNGHLAMAIETSAPGGWFWTDQAGVPGAAGNSGAPPNVPLNTWSHVVAQFDGVSMKLYVNGVLEQVVKNYTDGSPIAGDLVRTNQVLTIGGRPGSSWFDGKIDEVRVSNILRYGGTNVGDTITVPTGDFVTDINTEGLWHFDGATNSTVAVDSSGNGNTAALIGDAKIVAGDAIGAGNSLYLQQQPDILTAINYGYGYTAAPILRPDSAANMTNTGWQPMSNDGRNPGAPWGMGLVDNVSRQMYATFDAVKNFDLASVPAGPQNLTIAADNDSILYVNGVKVTTYGGWTAPFHTVDIQPYLQAGQNTIVMRYSNAGTAGVLNSGGPEGINVTGTIGGVNVDANASWAVRYSGDTYTFPSPDMTLAELASCVAPPAPPSYAEAPDSASLDIPPASNLMSIAKYNGGAFSDIDIESDIKLITNGGAANWAGIQFRKTGADDGYDTSGYTVRASVNGLELYDAVSHSVIGSANIPGLFTAGGAAHKVRIEAVGSRIKVFVDGAGMPVIDVTDPTPILTNGYIGISTSGSEWNFDNFIVGPAVRGGGEISVSHSLSFTNPFLMGPTEKLNFKGVIYADDGWTINVTPSNVFPGMPTGWTGNGSADGRLNVTPDLDSPGPADNPPALPVPAGVDTDGTWTRVYSVGNNLTTNAAASTLQGGVTAVPFNVDVSAAGFGANSTIMVTSVDGNAGTYGNHLPTDWAGGWTGGVGFYIGDNTAATANDLTISARTISGTSTANRYTFDTSTGKIIDLFSKTGYEGNFGHTGGSTQLSNINHVIDAPTNATGGDDQLLYDYVPDITNINNKDVYSFTNNVKAGLVFTVDASLTDTFNDSGKDGIQSIDAFQTQSRYWTDGTNVYDRFGSAKQNGIADDLATTSVAGTNTDNKYMTSNMDGILGTADDRGLIDYDPGTQLQVDTLINVPILSDSRLIQFDNAPGGESRIVTDPTGLNQGPVSTEGPDLDGIQYKGSSTWNEYSATFDFGFNGPAPGKETYTYLRHQDATHWIRVRYNGSGGLFLEKQSGGAVQILQSIPGYSIADPITAGAKLTFEAEGRNYRVYDNGGTLLMSHTDNINPLLYGSFAVGADTAAWWDNFAVTQLSLLKNIITLGDGAMQPNSAQDILNQLNLVVFRQEQGQNGLKYSRDMGSVYFQETAGSGYAQGMIPGTGGAGIIYTNKLETSNVDMAKQVTHLASTKDVYDTLSKQLVVYLDNISSVLSLFR